MAEPSCFAPTGLRNRTATALAKYPSPNGLEIQAAVPNAGGPVAELARNVSSSPAYTLVKLASGVHSVHSVADRETFHPVIGPSAEAQALYVRQVRLLERLKAREGEFVIWDVGLGAAANVL